MNISADGTTLLSVTVDDIQDGEFIIPDGIKIIGERAFQDCTNLSKLIIPDSVTDIHFMAFSRCNGLTEIYLPHSLYYLGDGAFESCKQLLTLHIPQSITQINERMFHGCSRLNMLCLPDSLTDIESFAFAGCSSLETLIIPAGVTHLYPGTFHDCHHLSTITLPSSLVYIEQDVFKGCHSLSLILINAETDADFQRILNLLTPKRRHLAIPKSLHHQAEEIKAHALLRHQITVSELKIFLEMTEDSMLEAIEKPNFFSLKSNRINLNLVQAKLVVTKKLIDWLTRDETVMFNNEEKNVILTSPLLSILESHHIDLTSTLSLSDQRCKLF